MASKTKIFNRAKKKTNPDVLEAIILARKNEKWIKVASILSGPTKKFSSVNLSDLEKQAKTGDTIVVLGKILSSGNLSKKIKICALSISEKAKSKLSESKSEFVHIKDEIKKNPKAEGVKII